MNRETEENYWIIYTMTPAEFGRLLGIPERVVTVSLAGDTVKIHAKPTD